MHTGIDQKIEDDRGIFADSDKPKNTLQYTGKTLFHTGGHIVDSLRPKEPDIEIKSQLGMNTFARPGALGSTSGSGNLSIGSIFTGVNEAVTADGIGGIIGGIKTVGGIISGTINTVTNTVNNVRNTVSNVYNAVNDVVSGITRPINDIVNAANEEIRNVNNAINGLDNSIDDLSDTVVNNPVIDNVNNTLNNIDNTVRLVNDTVITTNNLMSTIEGFPENIRLDIVRYINRRLNQNWITRGHSIDDLY